MCSTGRLTVMICLHWQSVLFVNVLIVAVQAFSIFFVCVTITSDVACYLLIPVQWLFFTASTYVWVQYIWQTGNVVLVITVQITYTIHHFYYYIHLMVSFLGQPGLAGTRKIKPVWI